MNIILQTKPGGWYVVGLSKEIHYTQQTVWIVRAKFLHPDGELHAKCYHCHFDTRQQAEKSLRKLAVRKVKGKGMKRMTLKDLPEEGFRHLCPDPDNWVEPEELFRLVQTYRRERYVYFKDVFGIEDYFQLNVEYIAFTTDDPEIFEVIDKYGDKRGCLATRFSRIENTEMTDQAIKAGVE